MLQILQRDEPADLNDRLRGAGSVSAELMSKIVAGACRRFPSMAQTDKTMRIDVSSIDPTTFNKSKRVTADKRQRWPSTESLAKCLAATGVSLDQFVALIAPARCVQLASVVPNAKRR